MHENLHFNIFHAQFAEKLPSLMMDKDDHLALFMKMLTFKLNLMGLNILSETFASSKMLITFSIKSSLSTGKLFDENFFN